MICFEGSSADAVWRQAAIALRMSGSLQPSRSQATRELLHVGFTITNPRQRLVYARPINPAFALAEVIWVLSGANDLAFLSFWNPRMRRFSDDLVTLHGAYGYRLGCYPCLSNEATHLLRHLSSQEGKRADQLRAAYQALRHYHHAHQIVLQIWDHTSDFPNPEPRSKDIPCSIMSHLLIRNERLEWLQVMRSNDLIWGTPYDILLFTTLQEIVAGWLQVEVGTYTHISDSLHIYESHWSAVDQRDNVDDRRVAMNLADLRVFPYERWERYWSQLVDDVLALTRSTQIADLLSIRERANALPHAYTEWVIVLTAEAMRKRGYWAEARGVIQDAGPFWETSWVQWAETKDIGSALR